VTLPPGPGSPLDRIAGSVIRGTQERLAPVAPPTRRPPDEEEKRLASELIQRGDMCCFCAGLHPGASGPACPRLASGKLNGDGTVVEFTYWPDQDWRPSAAERVVFVEELGDDVEEEP
jgi:hypothetical protein